MLVQKVRKFQKTQALWYMYQYSYLVEQVEELLSQFEWKSRDSPTETRLTDRYRSTDSLSFVTPANFPRAVTVRRMANDVTYTMYAALPIHLRVQSMVCESLCVCINIIGWRAGASQPSRATGTIFLYIYLDLYGRRFQINAT